ncbi:unnamed protein product, partial [Sphagnum compactum]
MKRVLWSWLDTTSFSEALNLQQHLVSILKTTTSKSSGYLLLLEHPPTYTIGRRGHRINLIENPNSILSYDIEKKHIIELGAEFIEVSNYINSKVSRGGLITFHGPGQIVGYPILNLTHFE